MIAARLGGCCLGVLLCLNAALSAQAAEPDERLSPPNAVAISTAEKAIRGVFEDQYKSREVAQRRELARELLQQAAGKNPPATEYVLLVEARDIGAKAGDPQTAARAVELLGKQFAIDTIKMKEKTLSATRVSRKDAAGQRLLAQEYIKLLKEASTENRYDFSQKALRALATYARKQKDKKFAAAIKRKQTKVKKLLRDAQKITAARGKLTLAPDDPAANLVLGRHYCFVREDWNKGLAHLSKSGDENLRALALTEIAKPTLGEAFTVLGDGWFDAAKAEKDKLARRSMYRRAGKWYGKVVEELEGLNRTRIEKRIEKIAQETGRDNG